MALPSLAYLPEKPLSLEEFQMLWAVVGDDLLGARDRVILALVVIQGVSPSRCGRICVEGMALPDILIVPGKGDRPREIVLAPITAEAIQSWTGLTLIKEGPLLVGLGQEQRLAVSGKGLHRSTIIGRLHLLGVRAGLTCKPHTGLAGHGHPGFAARWQHSALSAVLRGPV